MLVYSFLFRAIPDNDAVSMHGTLTNIIESRGGAVTGAIVLDEVEKVGIVLGTCNITEQLLADYVCEYKDIMVLHSQSGAEMYVNIDINFS